jgi:hypothetical protein
LCYEACRVGQSIYQLDGKCNQPIKSSTDRIRNDCCEKFFVKEIIAEETVEADAVDDDDDDNDIDDEDDNDDDQDLCTFEDDSREPCVCEEGYRFSKNESKCVPIAPGELRRTECNEGFRLNELNICKDVDECKEKQPCREFEICTNTEGSFSCRTCPSGYQKNPLNECEGEKCDTELWSNYQSIFHTQTSMNVIEKIFVKNMISASTTTVRTTADAGMDLRLINYLEDVKTSMNASTSIAAEVLPDASTLMARTIVNVRRDLNTYGGCGCAKVRKYFAFTVETKLILHLF